MITVNDLLYVVPMNTPVEIAGIRDNDEPFTIRPSSFREEVISQLGLLDKEVVLLRLDEQKNETVLRIVVVKG